MKQSICVIGDVLGCYYVLTELLKKIPKDNLIIFVGDLCDRGLHTKNVSELVINNGYECVLGNHDYFMINYVPKLLNNTRGEGEKAWFDKRTGDKETVASYKRVMKTLPTHIELTTSLLLMVSDSHIISRDAKKQNLRPITVVLTLVACLAVSYQLRSYEYRYN